MIALVFFRANNIGDGFMAIKKIFLQISAPAALEGKHLVYSIFVIIVAFSVEYVIEYKKVVVTKQNSLKVYTICSILMLSAILYFGVFDGGQFIYFQF